MIRSHRFFKDALFASALALILFAISCVELGPVPEFEYSYEFETSLPDVDTTSLAAENVEITEGSVDNAGAEAFSDDLSDATKATAYAQDADDALTAEQEEFWVAQTPESIRTALENGDAEMAGAVSSGLNSFQSNSSLLALLPATVDATGALSTSGRTGGANRTNNGARTSGTNDAQQDNLDECKQAAQDAFLEAKDLLDSIKAGQVAAVDKRYNSQLERIEGLRSPLEGSAQQRHDEQRTQSFEELYDEIAASTKALFDKGEITAAQRDQLMIINMLIYAFSYEASLNLLDSELTLIDNLINQAETNLNTSYNNLLATVNNNYNTELKALQDKRDKAQNSCHDQGGIHDQGGSN